MFGINSDEKKESPKSIHQLGKSSSVGKYNHNKYLLFKIIETYIEQIF